MTVPEDYERGRALFWTRPMDESEYDTPVLLTKASSASGSSWSAARQCHQAAGEFCGFL